MPYQLTKPFCGYKGIILYFKKTAKCLPRCRPYAEQSCRGRRLKFCCELEGPYSMWIKQKKTKYSKKRVSGGQNGNESQKRHFKEMKIFPFSENRSDVLETLHTSYVD